MFKKRKGRAGGAGGRSKFRRKPSGDADAEEPEQSVAERLAAVRDEQSSRGRSKGVQSESLMVPQAKASAEPQQIAPGIQCREPTRCAASLPLADKRSLFQPVPAETGRVPGHHPSSPDPLRQPPHDSHAIPNRPHAPWKLATRHIPNRRHAPNPGSAGRPPEMQAGEEGAKDEYGRVTKYGLQKMKKDKEVDLTGIEGLTQFSSSRGDVPDEENPQTRRLVKCHAPTISKITRNRTRCAGKDQSQKLIVQFRKALVGVRQCMAPKSHEESHKIAL